MVRVITDAATVAAVVAEAELSRRWRVDRDASRMRWRDNGEFHLAIRHRSSDGRTTTELLSAEDTPAGRDLVEAAAQFGCQAGFERLLAALKTDTVEA